MSDRREAEALGYILMSIRTIQSTLADQPDALNGATSNELSSSGKGIMWDLMTLADAAANKLGEELRRRHAEIDWRAIRAFRNTAAHGYMAIRMGPVRTIVRDDLPRLRDVVGTELDLLRRAGEWVPPEVRQD